MSRDSPINIHTLNISQLISKSIAKNHIIVHLALWTWQTNEFKRIKSCKQYEIQMNAAMILAVSISYAI